MRPPRESECGKKGRNPTRTSGICSDSWTRLEMKIGRWLHKSIFRAETLKWGGPARSWAAQEFGRVSVKNLVTGTEIQLELVKAKRRMYWLLCLRKIDYSRLRPGSGAPGPQPVRDVGSEAARTISPSLASAFLVLSHCILTTFT